MPPFKQIAKSKFQRKNEIEIQQIENGALQLSAPVEEDGSVTGFVMIETSPSPKPTSPSIVTPIIVGLIAFAVFIGAGFLLGESGSNRGSGFGNFKCSFSCIRNHYQTCDRIR